MIKWPQKWFREGWTLASLRGPLGKCVTEFTFKPASDLNRGRRGGHYRINRIEKKNPENKGSYVCRWEWENDPMIPALTVCQAGLRWAERPSSELSSSNNWLGSFTGESTGRVSFRVYFLHPNQINSWNFPPLGIKVAAHEVIQLCHSYQNRKCWSNLAPFKSQDSALAILYFFFFLPKPVAVVLF